MIAAIATLDAGPDPIPVSDSATLTAPGLSGEVLDYPRKRLGDPMLGTHLLDAFNGAAIEAQAILQISKAVESPPVDPNPDTLATPHKEPAMALQVDDPGPGWGQFVLQTDESGVTTWNFPVNPDGTQDTTPGKSSRTYMLRNIVPPPPSWQDGGIAGQAGTKTIHVLKFPWDNLLGSIAHRLVGDWEKKNRPYRMRTFSPQDYQRATVPDFQPAEWARMASGPSLLIVHGTFSQAHTDFGRLPADFVARLNATYDGRVFAFDHPTLSEDPKQNAQWFLDAMPWNTRLDLDVICHSRGGLVSRVLTEKFRDLSAQGRQVSIRDLIFIASPNSGTVLTNTDHVVDYLDAYTNILSFGPISAIGDVFGVITQIVKSIAAGVEVGLSGLESMRPPDQGGQFLKWLNVPIERLPTSKYFALCAEFEPPPDKNSGWTGWSSDRIDGIFGKPNDSIVPTDGVWAENGSSYFPIADHVTLTEAEGVDHGGFFQNRDSRDQIATWFNLRA
jgi:hypothetical protein